MEEVQKIESGTLLEKLVCRGDGWRIDFRSMRHVDLKLFFLRFFA